jgi:hypothetical protein
MPSLCHPEYNKGSLDRENIFYFAVDKRTAAMLKSDSDRISMTTKPGYENYRPYKKRKG